jgi:hypothetical protein
MTPLPNKGGLTLLRGSRQAGVIGAPFFAGAPPLGISSPNAEG